MITTESRILLSVRRTNARHLDKVAMENFKVTQFEECHPGTPFPRYRTLSSEECQDLRARLSSRFEFSAHTPLELLQLLASTAEVEGNKNADSDDFEIGDVFLAHGIIPRPVVYLNWYRLDKIDEMTSENFFRYFGDIWYPGADDIEVFDGDCSWIVFVRHDGAISIAREKSSRHSAA